MFLTAWFWFIFAIGAVAYALIGVSFGMTLAGSFRAKRPLIDMLLCVGALVACVVAWPAVWVVWSAADGVRSVVGWHAEGDA